MILRPVAIALIAMQCLSITQVYAATPTAKPHSKVVQRHASHPRVRKAIRPSPSSAWPPKGFTSVGTAFARVPTGSELVGILSATSDGAAKITSCAIDPKSPTTPAHSCAAVLVGATERCTWWKVTARVTGVDPTNPAARIGLGDIAVMQPGAAAKTIQTIFLVSPVPLQAGVRFIAMHALCGNGPSSDPVPGTTFAPIAIATPTPSPSNS